MMNEPIRHDRRMDANDLKLQDFVSCFARTIPEERAQTVLWRVV